MKQTADEFIKQLLTTPTYRLLLKKWGLKKVMLMSPSELCRNIDRIYEQKILMHYEQN